MALASLLLGALKGTGQIAATMGRGVAGGLGAAASAGSRAGGGASDVLSYLTGSTARRIEVESARTIQTQRQVHRITAADRASPSIGHGGFNRPPEPRILSQREQDAYNFDKSLGRVYGPGRPTNTQGLQDAMASRARARSIIGRKLIPAAGFVGAGFTAGAYIENRAQERRAYYGQEGYTARYGTSAETAASITRGAGYFLGAQTLLGINPFQGAARLGTRLVSGAKHRAKLYSARMSAFDSATRAERFGQLRRAVTADRLVNPRVRVSRPTGSYSNMTRGEIDRAGFSLIPGAEAEARAYAQRRVQAHTRSIDPTSPTGMTGLKVTGTGRPARRQTVVNSERRVRQRERRKQEVYDEAYNRKASTIIGKQSRQAAVNVSKQQRAIEREAVRSRVRRRIKDQTLDRTENRLIDGGYRTEQVRVSSVAMQANKPTRDRVARIDKRIAQSDKASEKFKLAGFNMNVFGKGGLAVAGTAYAGAMIASNPFAAATTIAGTAVLFGGYKVAGFVSRNTTPLAAAGVTIAAGAAIANSLPTPTAVEGDITSVEYDRQSPVQKLNYSTAGLVQSIHNNRRRM